MRSGLLSQAFDDGDSVMADKGFQIQDILPLSVTLNIPPFLLGDSKMSAEDVVRTQQIASLRIHVERAVHKIKNFRIWQRVVPLSLFRVVNQMWSVCFSVQYSGTAYFRISMANIFVLDSHCNLLLKVTKIDRTLMRHHLKFSLKV